MSKKEVWRMPPRFPGYDVSTGGRIRTYWQMRATASVVDRTAKPKAMTPTSDDGGRLFVIVHQAGGKKKNAVLARMILDTFVRQGGARDKVVYKDGDRSNVKLSNISYQQRPAKRKPKKAEKPKVGRSVIDLGKAALKVQAEQYKKSRTVSMNGAGKKGKADAGANKPARRAA